MGGRLVAALLGAALAAWIVTWPRMCGMDAGPGTDRGGLGWYVGVWVTMMAVMMLPSVALAAYGLYRLVAAVAGDALAWDRAGPYVAGGTIAAAGLYELTPLETVCLRHCRAPLHFVLGGWRNGAAGAVRMGSEHGLYCVGCCWGLMLVLFALGAMSVTWMAAIAAIVFAQKVLPAGESATRLLAVALVAGGAWVALAPSTQTRMR